ncbi:MAG: helix-turn-helix domain-containing protein [Bacilli bacterium]|nr:helix-turn-helix domain-containing protein [Bacilli bacterium]
MTKLNINAIKKNSFQVIENDYSYIDNAYLRNFRMKLKMSQSLFANYLGVSKKAIEKWEKEGNNINPLVKRMVFLIEKDPKILSLLMEVKMPKPIYETHSYKTFEFNEIENENRINISKPKHSLECRQYTTSFGRI